MHEASIVAGIIERLGEHPELAGRAVRVVRLRVGRLSTVVPANLEFLFGVLVEGTPLAGARLEIEDVAARAVCEACGAPFAVDDAVFLCPACGSGRVRLASGRELMIDSVETD
jgi:hydrogenase nickel incorporation protein HypA/HybF